MNRLRTWARESLAPAAMLFVMIVAILWLAGCARTDQSETHATRAQTETTTTTTQTLAPSGAVIALSARTTRTLRESAEGTSSGASEIAPPQIVVDGAKALAVAGASLIGGPVAGLAAEKASGWLEMALGGTALATSAASGYAAMQRKGRLVAERHRKQLIRSVESARDQLPDDADAAFIRELAARQDADLQAVVQRETT